MHKFSVIVPTYNVKKEFFDECINSIKKQTYENFEVIIIDDGSEQKFKKNYEDIIKDDKRFSIINQSNMGVSVARNNGVKKSTGDYIIFIDSDDYIEDNLLEKMKEVIDMYNKCDVILFEHFGWNKNEKKYTKFIQDNEKYTLIQQLMDENNWLDKSNELKHFGSVCNKCYRREYLCKNKIELVPNIKYSEDVLYSIKVLYKSDNIIYTNYELYHYRTYGESTFDRFNDNADSNFIDFIIELKKVLIELNLYDKMYQAYLIKIYTSYQFVMALKFFNKDNKNRDNKVSWKKFNNNKLIREMIFKINKSKINLKGRLVVYFAKYNFYLPIKLIYNLKNNIR